MTTQIVVVGAAGTIGSELVKQLTAAGRRFRALVRSEAKANSLPSLADPVIGDLLAPGTLARAFEGAERVFVLCPPTADMEKMVANAFHAAREARARHIVYLSAFGAGTLEGPHWRAHAANERRLTTLGLDWTVLRPARFMTHTPYTWAPVFGQGLLLEGGRSGIFPMIDPADIAAVARRALTEDGHSGQTYVLTSEDEYAAADLARTISEAIRREVRVFEGDDEALQQALIAGGVPPEYAPLMVGAFKTVAAGSWYLTTTASEILGRPARNYALWLEHYLPRLRRP
jgi:uncharacterized protein YbjT (DUF2867 family)